MSNFFKIGGRYGFHSGSGKVKNFEISGDYKGRTMITMGLGPAMAENSFPHDTTSNTEQAAALCLVFDQSADSGSGEFQTLAGSATGNGYGSAYQMFPDTEAENDAIYFGYASKFACFYLNMTGTAAVHNGDSCVWEYWNGDAWGEFEPYDQTDTNDQDGDRPFQGDGYILLNVGEGWGTRDVNSTNAYWIRCRIANATITTIPKTASVEHAVTTLTNGGTVINTYGTISRGLFRFETASDSTDTTVLLVNMSAGKSSTLKTITATVKDADITDFNLEISRGDSIAFFCETQASSTQFAGGTCELAIDHS